MADDTIYTEVGNRKLKLTNSTKLMYPDEEISKAQVIQYYLEVADYMLPHIKNRPLTLIRFPDGIKEESFYSKNIPSWAPEWVERTQGHDDKENDYVFLNELPTLIWIANLAGLEIHPMNARVPNLNFPDQYIYDLDPSEDFDFEDLKDIALKLKAFLTEYDYNVYIKTSGGKGLHLYLPIKPIYAQDVVYDTFEKLTKEFQQEHKDVTTLNISKKKRKGKILLDIYRNRKSQSCVAPYSLRGRKNAPVSMPIKWEELKALKSSQQWDIKTALEKLKKDGDAWAEMWENPTTLHTHKSKKKS